MALVLLLLSSLVEQGAGTGWTMVETDWLANVCVFISNMNSCTFDTLLTIAFPSEAILYSIANVNTNSCTGNSYVGGRRRKQLQEKEMLANVTRLMWCRCWLTGVPVHRSMLLECVVVNHGSLSLLFGKHPSQRSR